MKEKLIKTDYQQAIDVLTSQGKFYINLGLERVQKYLELIGNPQDKLKFIHVAGTNGKGSVCAMLSAILQRSGFVGRDCHPDNKTKVGLFTSPHVFDYTERIKINDVEISKQDFAQGINDIIDLADKNDIHLTEFEILTITAFEHFAKNNVDIVVLETGLGGRLDSTNVIKNNICSIITNIDFDHTERLGDTIEKIAFEKAGIIKRNCAVVISEKNAGFEVVKKFAQNNNSKIFLACHCEQSEAIQTEGSLGLLHRGYAPPRNDRSLQNLSLKGTYQQENLALALTAIDVLNNSGFEISEEQIMDGLKQVKHPCRFEYLTEHNIIIDGAHNPNGTKALRKSLEKYFPNQEIKFIFGCLRNKEYKKMLDNLFDTKIFTPEVYFYHFDNPNSCEYDELASVCEFTTKPFNEYKHDKTKLTVICGSFYMIKELLDNMGVK